MSRLTDWLLRLVARRQVEAQDRRIAKTERVINLALRVSDRAEAHLPTTDGLARAARHYRDRLEGSRG